MYEIAVEKFAGPLELLLSLVEEQKLSINEISLREVADQYIGYLHSLEKMPKEELAAFLVVAATLMLLKSKSLLPSLILSPEEETDIKELENRLKLYKLFKQKAKVLLELQKKGTHLFGREAYVGMLYAFVPPNKLKVSDLRDAVAKIFLELPKSEQLNSERIKKSISIEDKIAELKKRIDNAITLSFDEIKHGQKNSAETIVSFLALLELVKQGFLLFEQKATFGTIHLKRHE
jgi:segregation and condensation protein A